MKRLFLIFAAAASVAAATPLAAPAFARGDDQGRGRGQRVERSGPPADRGGGRRYDVPRSDYGGRGRRDDGERFRRPYYDEPRGRAPVLGYGDRREERQRYEPRPRYESRPRYDERPRYDDRPRYGDGGPPRARGFAAPPPNARRGGYLPRSYSGEIIDDYRRYRLRAPPAGFAWVRVGRGFALVSMADGQIFDMVQ